MIKTQKMTESLHLPKQHSPQPHGRGSVQTVAPHVAYRLAQVDRGDLTPGTLLALQRTLGNRQVQRIIEQRVPNAYSVNKGAVVPFASRTKTGNAQSKMATDTNGNVVYRLDVQSFAKRVVPLVHIHPPISRNRLNNVISCWGGDTHKAMTSEVGETLGIGGMALRALRHSSIGMDWRVRRLIKAGWRAVFEKPAFTIKAEGPDHGEGGWYVLGWEAARAANIARQIDYRERAIKAYQDYRDRRRSPSDALEEMYGRLGDALHVAQDRGAHNEGTKGFGHNDPRLKDGYDPDNPAHNPSGVRAALENTYDVLSTFLTKTGLLNSEKEHISQLRFQRQMYNRLRSRYMTLAKQTYSNPAIQAELDEGRQDLRVAHSLLVKDKIFDEDLTKAREHMLWASAALSAVEYSMTPKQLGKLVVQRLPMPSPIAQSRRTVPF